MKYQNPIWVSGNINNQDFYTKFTQRWSELMGSTKSGDEITLFINSPGGESYTALGIYDLINASDRNVIGIVTGTAQSGASLILQSCKKRLMTKNSTLMLHRSSIQIAGTVTNAKEALSNLEKVDEKFYEIYAKRAGESAKKISEMAHKDTYFTPEEALNEGLIDLIEG